MEMNDREAVHKVAMVFLEPELQKFHGTPAAKVDEAEAQALSGPTKTRNFAA